MVAMNRCGLLLLSLLLLTCGKAETGPDSDAPALTAVVEQALEEHAGRGLPVLEDAAVEEVLELLEMAAQEGRSGHRSRQRLLEREPLTLASALLDIVEDRESLLEEKRQAYAWLAAVGPSAMLPRLTLRLKYEKDFRSNVDIALALLRHGCGAGLLALETILMSPADDPALEETRFAASQALRTLPPKEGWEPGQDFQQDWARLKEVQAHWFTWHQLPGPSMPMDAGCAAETWRTLAKLQSQRLRPVDDARFVLSRLPAWVFPLILQTGLDADPYVREHALQTLAWIGYPLGRWAQAESFDASAYFADVLAIADTRPRALEALGAFGLPDLASLAVPWLTQGDLDTRTAAADALLRCADRSLLLDPATPTWSESVPSPEGHYSLQLLAVPQDSPDAELPQPPEGLDASEAQRRRRWWQERGGRPGQRGT